MDLYTYYLNMYIIMRIESQVFMSILYVARLGAGAWGRPKKMLVGRECGEGFGNACKNSILKF